MGVGSQIVENLTLGVLQTFVIAPRVNSTSTWGKEKTG
jgi:hypothetical protein